MGFQLYHFQAKRPQILRSFEKESGTKRKVKSAAKRRRCSCTMVGCCCRCCCYVLFTGCSHTNHIHHTLSVCFLFLDLLLFSFIPTICAHLATPSSRIPSFLLPFLLLALVSHNVRRRRHKRRRSRRRLRGRKKRKGGGGDRSSFCSPLTLLLPLLQLLLLLLLLR